MGRVCPEPLLPACITLDGSQTEPAYAQRFTGYGTGPRLTSPGVWSSVHHGTAPAPDVSPPHPPHDTRPRDRGGVRARVVASRPRDVACLVPCSYPCRSYETDDGSCYGG